MPDRRLLNLVTRAARTLIRSLESSAERPRSAAAGRGALSPQPATGGRAAEVDPRSVSGLTFTYAPDADGDADAGEVVWAWVPYEERDGRGKDRPVLVIATDSAGAVFALKLTTGGDTRGDHLSIGSGDWDRQGRESFVDLGQLYRLDRTGLRREGAALDRQVFERVAEAWTRRFGSSRRG